MLWCEKIERPRRKPPEELEEREWRSWTEVEEWARVKGMSPVVEKWFEEAGG